MIRLECKLGDHNKFYELALFKTNGRVTVKGFYGRIGGPGSETIIYDGDNEAEAQNELEKKKNEKLKKGYTVVTSNGESIEQPVQKKTVSAR